MKNSDMWMSPDWDAIGDVELDDEPVAGSILLWIAGIGLTGILMAVWRFTV